MKVLCISSTYKRTQQDRIGFFISELNRRIHNNGIDIEVLAPHGPDLSKIEIFDDITVIRFPYFIPKKMQRIAYGNGVYANLKNSSLAKFQIPFYILSLTVHLIKLLRSHNYSIIHVHWLFPQGIIAIVLGKIFNIPTVITIHGTDIRKLPRWISQFFLKRCNVIISPHPEISQILTSISMNFIEIPNIIPEPLNVRDLSSVLKRFELTSEPVISFIARFDLFKDPITLVKSIPLILQKNPKIQFVIAGDGPLRQEVESELKKCSNNTMVKMPGWIDDPDSLISISSIFLSLSPIENIWSLSLVEAMNAGVPCIATKSGTTKLFLTHMVDAYLIEPSNPEQLTDAILYLVEHPEIRKKIGKQGKNLIFQKFNSNKEISDRICNVYTSLCHNVQLTRYR